LIFRFWVGLRGIHALSNSF